VLAIHALAELTHAIEKSARASTRLLKAIKSAEQERGREATRSWFAAQEERRGIWRPMATSVPAGEELDQQRGRKTAEEE